MRRAFDELRLFCPLTTLGAESRALVEPPRQNPWPLHPRPAWGPVPCFAWPGLYPRNRFAISGDDIPPAGSLEHSQRHAEPRSLNGSRINLLRIGEWIYCKEQHGGSASVLCVSDIRPHPSRS